MTVLMFMLNFARFVVFPFSLSFSFFVEMYAVSCFLSYFSFSRMFPSFSVLVIDRSVVDYDAGSYGSLHRQLS